MLAPACSADEPQFFYHVHSYHPAEVPDERRAGHRRRTAASSPPSWARGNVVGAQFHPEKSQRAGHRAARRLRAVAPVTSVRVSLVDLYVLRGAGPSLECLVLRRAAGGRCPGSWEAVHGHIEPGETPAEAARRELRGGDGTRARAAVQPEPGRDVLSAPARRGGAGAGVRRVRRAGRRGPAPAPSTTGSSGSRRPRPARRFAWPRERARAGGRRGPARRGRRGRGGGRAPRMLARRIIPCLDVAGGRVVKGVHFTVAARRRRSGGAGRPLRRRGGRRARLPRHLGQPRGAGAPRSRWWRGWRNRSSSRSPWAAASAPWPTPGAALRAGADKVSVNTAAVRDPVAGLPPGGELRVAVRGGGGGRHAASTGGSR